MKKIKLLYHTVKYLRPTQIFYQIFYKLRNKFAPVNRKKLPSYILNEDFVPHLKLKEGITSYFSYSQANTFTFLNQSKTFGEKIDWNYNGFGKLWTYNLNYFEFLHQENFSKEDGLRFIQDYIDQQELLRDGLEPYPISLRTINWIKFLAKYNIQNSTIDEVLFNHYQILLKNLEYHLLGNHLLENGFSLFIGAYYFKNDCFLKKATEILATELKEQILKDGGHFELSPMYHQIIFYRLLDCINVQQNNSWNQDSSRRMIEGYASLMLSWLQAITFSNGEIPMLNDSSSGIAPSSKQLVQYAQRLYIEAQATNLSDSGYRKWATQKWEAVMDIGEIGPSYIPGHAHADTFNFVMNYNELPFIVDTGISTYEKNARRQYERSTVAHNTVEIGNENQSQVWGGFRVAKRAKIISLSEQENLVKASHNGYQSSKGIIHERTFKKSHINNLIQLVISDNLMGAPLIAKCYLHFHPSVSAIEKREDGFYFPEVGSTLIFSGEINDVSIIEYEFCEAYNQLRKAKCIQIIFTKNLETLIY